MGPRFDGQGVEPLTREEALCALVCHSMYTDATVTQEEDTALHAYLQTLRTFRGRGRRVKQALSKVNRMARQEGEEALLHRAAEVLPDEMRPAAYFAVADLVLSDHDLSPEEEAYLDQVRGMLGLGDEQAHSLLEVARIKNVA